MLKDLEAAVRGHKGEFLCVERGNEHHTKTIRFEHVLTDPTDVGNVPDVGDLRDFYSTFGSIVFYHDAHSDEAGKYLAPVESWASLRDDFNLWFDDLPDDEREDLLPSWIDTALVIGETPASGNYILIPTEGPEAGHVFEFDHDGFEFRHTADTLAEYVQRLLKPDGSMLTEIASHMCFMEEASQAQWWIQELRDNQGHLARTME